MIEKILELASGHPRGAIVVAALLAWVAAEAVARAVRRLRRRRSPGEAP